MKIVHPKVEMLTPINRNVTLQLIERAGRTCYKSEANITPSSASKFVANLTKRQHYAMLEHGGVFTARIITDRAIANELVRHRIASYAQESTRYVKYDKGFTFCCPAWLLAEIPDDTDIEFALNKDDLFWEETTNFSKPVALSSKGQDFIEALRSIEQAIELYKQRNAPTAQDARALYPSCLKTEILVTMNLRAWLHFFELRLFGTTGAPHPDMEYVASLLYREFHEALPEIFTKEYEPRKETSL